MKHILALLLVAALFLGACTTENLAGEGINVRTGEAEGGDKPVVFFRDGANIATNNQGMDFNVGAKGEWNTMTLTRNGELHVSSAVKTNSIFGLREGNLDINANRGDLFLVSGTNDVKIRALQGEFHLRSGNIDMATTGNAQLEANQIEIDGQIFTPGIRINNFTQNDFHVCLDKNTEELYASWAPCQETSNAPENDQPGSDLYRFTDIDLAERVVTFVQETTGNTREISLIGNYTSNNFVHEGRTFSLKYAQENVLSLDLDNDGSYETVVFLGNTFEMPSYR